MIAVCTQIQLKADWFGFDDSENNYTELTMGDLKMHIKTGSRT